MWPLLSSSIAEKGQQLQAQAQLLDASTAFVVPPSLYYATAILGDESRRARAKRAAADRLTERGVEWSA